MWCVYDRIHNIKYHERINCRRIAPTFIYIQHTYNTRVRTHTQCRHIYAQVRSWAIILSTYIYVHIYIYDCVTGHRPLDILGKTRYLSSSSTSSSFLLLFFLSLPPYDDGDDSSGARSFPLFRLSSPLGLLFCIPSSPRTPTILSLHLVLSFSLSFPRKYILFDLQLVSGRCSSNGLVNRKRYDLPELQ